MAGKNCVICNTPSGIYPLCKKHLVMKNKGLVVKDKEGDWILKEETTESVDLFPTIKEYNHCIICSKETNKNPLCNECSKEVIERKDEFDKNQQIFELKDYYFNLRSNIYRIVNIDNVKSNSKKLLSLSLLTNDLYKDISLIKRVIEDVEEIIEKKSKISYEPTPYTEKSDSQKASLIRTQDGHVVKSKGEQIIDDILYNNFISHCYEKDVNEISPDERTVSADFYIPVAMGKGIYIEFWGMDSDEYNKNRVEKKELYKKYNVQLIEVDKSEINDTSTLSTRIMREYTQLKEQIKKSI